MTDRTNTWRRAAELFDELAELSPDHRERELSRREIPEEVRAWLAELLLRHGRGGMGIVLAGERADGQYEMQVAIKLLDPAAFGPSLKDLFRREIRFLAELSHPGIAQLLDGGLTEDGTPYLVMEYIHGRPIDRYCDDRGLNIDERLTLFLQVADAVAYCHRHLVVHGDIKPGNVLVDDDGLVKLLDFGIASRLAGDSREAEGDLRLRWCSPGHAAPERMAGGTPATVSEDTFGLGAVLYELLTGSSIRSAPEMTRLLRGKAPNERPVPLSQRAAQRGLPRRQARRLAGDLETIVDCMTATDPDQRYGTVEAMIDDIRRWRESQPVLARDGGRIYRLGRWWQRHRVGAVAGLIAIGALVVGSSVAVWQARQAREAQVAAEYELERARTLNEFVVGLFEGARHSRPRNEVPTTRELLVRGAEEARKQFSDQPGLRSEMLAVIGDLFMNVGLMDAATDALAEAVEIRERISGRDSAKLGEAKLEYGQALHFSGQLDPSIEQLQQAVHALRNSDSEATLARALHALGFALTGRSRFEEAVSAHEEALKIQRRIGDPAALGRGLSTTARTLQRDGQLDASATAYAEALELLRDAFGNQHYLVASTLGDYGVTLRRLSRLQEAERVLRAAISAGEGVFTGPHPLQAQRWNNLGSVLVAQGDRPAAIRAFNNAEEEIDSLPGATQEIRAGVLNNLGYLSMSVGAYQEAESHLRSSLELIEEWGGRDHPHHITVSRNLGRSLGYQEKFEQAETILQDALQRARESHGTSDERFAGILSALGQVRWRRDRDPAALEMIRRAYEVTRSKVGTDNDATIQRALALADALAEDNELPEARSLYEQALEASSQKYSELHHNVLAARTGLAEVLLALEQPHRAHEALQPIDTLPPDELIATDPLHGRMEALSAELDSFAAR